MTNRVAVIGARLSGRTGAIRLAQRGYRVMLPEARSAPGGLASPLRASGLEREIPLVRLETAYEVRFPDDRGLDDEGPGPDGPSRGAAGSHRRRSSA